MKSIIPKKLQKGDEIRVIAPSRSMTLLDTETIQIAKQRLEELGLVVTFGKNVNQVVDDDYNCASINERVSDLHDAFSDKIVKAILTVIGGFNVNQILDYIDYDLIRQNPKIICGFSDITALLNAIYTKTGLITYYGPHFSSFGMKKGFDYTLEYFKKSFLLQEDYSIEDSQSWSDDLWFLNQDERLFYTTNKMKVVNNKNNNGTIIGGNLCTLNLLQGTDYMPDDDNITLFLEDDDLITDDYIKEFDRNLQSLLHSLKNKTIRGLVLGRAQIKTKMNDEKWIKIIQTKKELQNIPIIINAPFGHTTPIITFPIGGEVSIIDGQILIKNK